MKFDFSCPEGPVVELTQSAQRISLPRRTLQHCLAEELLRLVPDKVFGETVRSFDTSKEYQKSQVAVAGSMDACFTKDKA